MLRSASAPTTRARRGGRNHVSVHAARANQGRRRSEMGSIRDRAGEVLGNEVSLWATTLSSAFGTLTWTSWWQDLSTLQNETAKLSTDKKYMGLAAEGLKFVDRVDDGLYQALYFTEGDFSSLNVVSTVRAVRTLLPSKRPIASWRPTRGGLSTSTRCGVTPKTRWRARRRSTRRFRRARATPSPSETADESSNELVGHFVEALPPASADASDPVAP